MGNFRLIRHVYSKDGVDDADGIMIELAFVVCLNTAPTTCENRALQYTELTANACLMGAQPELARWVGEHPGWQIQRWTCREINSDLEI